MVHPPPVGEVRGETKGGRERNKNLVTVHLIKKFENKNINYSIHKKRKIFLQGLKKKKVDKRFINFWEKIKKISATTSSIDCRGFRGCSI